MLIFHRQSTCNFNMYNRRWKDIEVRVETGGSNSVGDTEMESQINQINGFDYE